MSQTTINTKIDQKIILSQNTFADMIKQKQLLFEHNKHKLHLQF
jgi:hypothetical protein